MPRQPPQKERDAMRVVIQEDYRKMCKWASDYIAARIKTHREDRPFVLGLPTGSSPIGVYQELVRQNRAGELSFANVVTFNMDEYVGLPEEHPESYHSFMWNNFFKHIDIKPENVNILDGNAEDLAKECADYEARIVEAGGIDLFMGGVGEDGHIAFNEPGDDFGLETHVVDLTESTIEANKRFFESRDEVPRHALSMGIKNIMSAKKVLLLASGKNKAKAVYESFFGPIVPGVPASVLQLHNDVIVIADEEALSLCREKGVI